MTKQNVINWSGPCLSGPPGQDKEQDKVWDKGQDKIRDKRWDKTQDICVYIYGIIYRFAYRLLREERRKGKLGNAGRPAIYIDWPDIMPIAPIIPTP